MNLTRYTPYEGSDLESEAYPIRAPSSRRPPPHAIRGMAGGSFLGAGLLVYRLEEAAEDGKAWVNLVLGAVDYSVWPATPLAALWARGIAMQNQLADEVEPFDREPTKVNGVPWSEAFYLARCEALFNDLFVKGRLEAGACRRKAARAEPLLRTRCTPNDPHAAIRSVSTQLRFSAEALATRFAHYAEMWNRDTRTRWLREKW